MTDAASPEYLSPDVALRLAEFARACKAAARAVSLYPATHPAIRISISRLTDVAAKATAGGSLVIQVLPNTLLIDGHAAARPDAAIGELAALLHQHLVGAFTVHGRTDADVWLPFFVMLARPTEEIRDGGGVARVWSLAGKSAIELQEIDYSAVLRERTSGQIADWEEIVANCLQSNAVDLDEKAIGALLEVAGDADRLAELIVLLEERTSSGGVKAQTAALVRMLKGIVEIVARTEPDRLESALRNISTAIGGLSSELMLELLSGEKERAEGAADLVLQVINRMSDGTIAEFVAKNIVAQRGATGRLAQAFQALVPEIDRRRLLVEMAESRVAESPLAAEAGFPELMASAKEMLTTYSDEPFVSDDYARELSGARTQAIEVERTSDDPPERVSAWLATVNEVSLRGLDLQLLLDLLTIETDPVRWQEVTDPVVYHIEDLLLVGDFEAALRLVEALVREAGPDGNPERRSTATAAIERLAQGQMMRNQAVDFRTMDDPAFEVMKKICYAIGPVIIPPLAESLSVEEHERVRQRLTALLLGFGAAGKQSVERLKNSANPAVRRTAVHLLREFGGSEALPELTTLLDDAEPHVQREALRAILAIGTEEAYDVLRSAMAKGTERTRTSLMVALMGMRDERAAPLFGYIVRHVDHRGILRDVFLRSVEALGTFRDELSIDLLKEALYRGEWWTPRRTAKLRGTVARALKRIGTPAAIQALQHAAESGPRGVRAAARAQLR
jgi:HEAT repeat protein